MADNLNLFSSRHPTPDSRSPTTVVSQITASIGIIRPISPPFALAPACFFTSFDAAALADHAIKHGSAAARSRLRRKSLSELWIIRLTWTAGVVRLLSLD